MRAPSAVEAAGRAAPRPEPPVNELRTEFALTPPCGYVDSGGRVHRDGIMRLATAKDELVPLHDDRVRENQAYLTVVLLARRPYPHWQHHRRPPRPDREPFRH